MHQPDDTGSISALHVHATMAQLDDGYDSTTSTPIKIRERRHQSRLGHWIGLVVLVIVVLEQSTSVNADCLPDYCAGLLCLYGRAYDTDGCVICDCVRPCEDVNCTANQRCEEVPVSGCDGIKCPKFTGICRDIPTTTKRPPCPVISCNTSGTCRFGYKTIGGCRTCQCVDLCEGYTCRAGEKCQLTADDCIPGPGVVCRDAPMPYCVPDVQSSSTSRSQAPKGTVSTTGSRSTGTTASSLPTPTASFTASTPSSVVPTISDTDQKQSSSSGNLLSVPVELAGSSSVSPTSSSLSDIFTESATAGTLSTSVVSTISDTDQKQSSSSGNLLSVRVELAGSSSVSPTSSSLPDIFTESATAGTSPTTNGDDVVETKRLTGSPASASTSTTSASLSSTTVISTTSSGTASSSTISSTDGLIFLSANETNYSHAVTSSTSSNWLEASSTALSTTADIIALGGVFRINASFSIIDDQDLFQRSITQDISTHLAVRNDSVTITGLESGSIIVRFIVVVELGDEFDAVQRRATAWSSSDAQVGYRGFLYPSRLVSFNISRDVVYSYVTRNPNSPITSDNFFLMVIMVCVLVPLGVTAAVVVTTVVICTHKKSTQKWMTISRGSSVESSNPTNSKQEAINKATDIENGQYNMNKTSLASMDSYNPRETYA